MPDFDRIDLMNFVVYGNDFDPQWDEIRHFVKTNPSAQREVEDIKKNLPSQTSLKRKKDGSSIDSIFDSQNPNGRDKSNQKGFWKKILG